MTLFVLDDIIKNPDEYVEDVLQNAFVDVEDSPGVFFKGIQPRMNDEVEKFVLKLFPSYGVSYNFILYSCTSITIITRRSTYGSCSSTT